MGFADYLGRFWYSSEPMFGVIMVVCFTSVLRAFPDATDKVVETILNRTDRAISVTTTHFSTWAVLAKTTSASNGMPVWGWVLLGIGAVAGLGALVYARLFGKPAKEQ